MSQRTQGRLAAGMPGPTTGFLLTVIDKSLLAPARDARGTAKTLCPPHFSVLIAGYQIHFIFNHGSSFLVLLTINYLLYNTGKHSKSTVP